MATDLRCVFILVLLGPSLLLATSYLRNKNYVHVTEELLSWSAAQEYCDTFHSGPLIIDNEAQDMELGYRDGWIALRQNIHMQWQWPGGGSLSYSRLDGVEGINNQCAERVNYAWKKSVCHSAKSFFCADEKLLLIKENKTWEQALEHCRGLWGINRDKALVGYQLVNLGKPDDYLFASEKALNATTAEVWTGLRFLTGRWFWLNRWQWRIPTTLALCPEQNNFCAALSLSSNSFETSNCMTKRNFLCFKWG